MPKPSVSIILPTYNRARFLPEAFGSIRGQTLTDWELIVVDDGSTDETRGTIERLAKDGAQPVQYHWQENQGPDVARNRGLDAASGRFVAFYDSDDRWLPHHLDSCLREFEANPDVDWIFTASRGESPCGRTVFWESSFHESGELRPFLRMQTERRGPLNVLVDPRAVDVALRESFNAGPQVSVFRSEVFANLRLPEYRIGPDQTFVAIAIANGFRLAYIDAVHLIYRCHEGNISLSSNKPIEQRLALMQAFTGAFEELRHRLPLTPSQRRILDRRLSREYFWNMGYPLALAGRYDEALTLFARAIRLSPGTLGFYKTALLAWLRKCRSDLRGQRNGTSAERN